MRTDIEPDRFDAETAFGVFLGVGFGCLMVVTYGMVAVLVALTRGDLTDALVVEVPAGLLTRWVMKWAERMERVHGAEWRRRRWRA